jgi:hypothetical protein
MLFIRAPAPTIHRNLHLVHSLTNVPSLSSHLSFITILVHAFSTIKMLCRSTPRVLHRFGVNRSEGSSSLFSHSINTGRLFRAKSGLEYHNDVTTDMQRNYTSKNPVPDFNDTHAAYETKSNKELLRAVVCFRLCTIPPLVNQAEGWLRTSRFLLGSRITNAALKATLYSHFCAGEDQERIRPIIQKLQDAGIGSILDYAAENDQPNMATAPLPDLPLEEQNIRVQTYDYESEAQCDRHVETFGRCINDVASLGPDGFAAVKITALGNPKLLARLSTAIVEAKRLFQIFDTNGDGVLSREEFEFGYK